MTKAYYNEHDPFAAAWLRNLIFCGLIADGDVDERSIEDVLPSDLKGYTQCHFFAGLGGWAYALRLARWPDDRPVWTGSCPCQPFSAAGKGDGFADERHLWPAWFHLIEQCQPGVIFGEQVEAAIKHGWLDLVQADLEGIGYAFGAVGIPAAGVGAPHIRQRLWFVAESQGGGNYGALFAGERERLPQPIWTGVVDELADAERGTAERRGHDVGAAPRGAQEEAREWERLRDDAGAGGDVGELADAEHAERWPQRVNRQAERDGQDAGRAEAHRIAGTRSEIHDTGRLGVALGDADNARSQGRSIHPERTGELAAGPSGLAGFWREADWLPCRDGKARPVEPGTFPLAHGVPARVGRLRGYGNAIVPQVAKAFIEAYLTSDNSP